MIRLFCIECNSFAKVHARSEFYLNVHTHAHTYVHAQYHKKNYNRILRLFQWLPSLSHTQLRALIHDKLSHLIHDKSSEGQIEMRKLREKRRPKKRKEGGRASGAARERHLTEREKERNKKRESKKVWKKERNCEKAKRKRKNKRKHKKWEQERVKESTKQEGKVWKQKIISGLAMSLQFNLIKFSYDVHVGNMKILMRWNRVSCGAVVTRCKGLSEWVWIIPASPIKPLLHPIC